MKYSRGASTIQKVATVAGLCVALVLSLSFGVAAMGFVKEGEPSPYGDKGIQGGPAGSKACWLKDEAFRDTFTVNNSEYVYNKIGDRYPALNNAKNKDNINKIIQASINGIKGKNGEYISGKINPAVLISFYFGEQTFNQRNDYKAFGCGKFSGEDKGIDQQIECALPLIGYAIEKQTSPGGVNYGAPSGANTWNRLLYHYVSAARKASFDKYGYVTDNKESRIQLLTDLVPEQVECAAPVGVTKFDSLEQVQQYFGTTPEEIKKHLVQTKFMGKSITVNEMMSEDLKKVESRIKNSGYQIKTIEIGDNFSAHKYGLAIDINKDDNKPSADPSCKSNIPDSVKKAFKDSNLYWGGEFDECNPMHFQYGGDWD